MPIGDYLRSIRRSKGLSIRRLADGIGVNPSYVSRVERGLCPPSRPFLVRVASELDASEPHLFSLAGFMPQQWAASVTEQAFGGPPNTIQEISLSFGGVNCKKTDGFLQDPLDGFFPSGLVPSNELNEIYELRLAKLEAQLLTRQQLIERGAYFLAVDGKPTNHFKLCTGGAVELPREASSRLHSFLGNHRFKSSYATHGLFPYRGKFHPQMIKAIINIMGLAPGQTVLDPMAGSGTTAIEACLMGIDALAAEVSPFCVFMTQAKLAGLIEDIGPLEKQLTRTEAVGRLFSELSGEAGRAKVINRDYRSRKLSRGALDILALAYMDARGYTDRSSRNNHEGFFTEVLTKYLRTIRRFQDTWAKMGLSMGKARVLEADARHLPLEDQSVDGVVFSPPYSFAIDYLENDLAHLSYLGADVPGLRSQMIGLRGKGARQRTLTYFDDMTAVFKEVVRVLRPGRHCVLIVGSNANQLAKALNGDPQSPEMRCRLEWRLSQIAEGLGLNLELPIRRLIVGMANTMREEHILFFRKGTAS